MSSLGVPCLTCADAATLGSVVSVAEREATVETAAGLQRVAIELVAPVRPGELLLCHAGVALSRVSAP
jgi:hydrogenase maturation factor